MGKSSCQWKWLPILLVLVVSLILGSCNRKHTAQPFNPAEGTALDFWMELVSGPIYNASDAFGSVVLINFWDTWCGPCRYEQPDLNQLYTEFSDDGLEIIGISLAHEGVPAVAAYLDEFNVEYPSGIIGPGVTETHPYPVSIPHTLIIDRAGVICHELTGSRSYETFAELITPLLSE